ncbi:hypothetical protein PHISCL_05827 [Aspergillus sclerotialis]|uniref:Uncharacterized protein n=1 Tax=Aspergillus sclerotialis TaxID=2070753 RepID=A0A3A2ZHS7_9EURO|nr:hypothetical protein PHISCL_05827 [Aspergillus sclerotialis]
MAIRYLTQNKKVLIVMGSNRALDVIRVRLTHRIQQMNLGSKTLYRLETEYMESSGQQQAPSVPNILDQTDKEFKSTLRHLRNAGMEILVFELLRAGILNK